MHQAVSTNGTIVPNNILNYIDPKMPHSCRTENHSYNVDTHVPTVI